jgi:predicted acyltransferase
MKFNFFQKKEQSQNPSGRLLSLDALRGFDMMWIISGELIVHALAKASGDPVSQWMSDQLHHTKWNGFTFYDMIFPLFIFIAGVSMPYSMGKTLENPPENDLRKAKRAIYKSLIKRTLILLVCGMVVNGLLKWNDYDHTRFASVLGRIALSCFFAGVIFLNTKLRGQIAWFWGLLLGYWAVMMLVPVPLVGSGVLSPTGNFSAYIDQLFLPGKLHRHFYDPEGILSTLPAISTALLGVFTGRFLRWKSTEWTMQRKSYALAAIGLACLGLGLVWDFVFPINKNMWTSSFVLYAGGYSLLLLAVFYFIIDVKGLKAWCMPFVWIGTNSILIYMASHGLVNFQFTSQALFGGMIKHTPEIWQPVWLSTGILIIQLALLYFLHKKKWFLKV